MQSLWFIKPGEVEWREVEAPRLQGDLEAIVEPTVAATCDIDRLLLEGRPPYHRASAFGQPFPIGHEGGGRVVEIGDRVSSVRVGDRVAIAWRPHCDDCGFCARGLTAYCERFARGTSYGLPTGEPWGGLFDERVRVPFADAMLARLPAGVSDLEAVSAADNASLGRALVYRHLCEGRRNVLVLGWGAAGLYAAAYARLLGAERVVYVDPCPNHCRIAEQLGAETHAGPPGRGLGRFDLVVDAAFRPEWLSRVVYLLEPEGAIECLAHFTDFSLPGYATYAHGVNFHCAVCSNGPHVEPTLRQISASNLDSMRVRSQLVAWADLPAAMVDPGLKLVARRAS